MSSSTTLKIHALFLATARTNLSEPIMETTHLFRSKSLNYSPKTLSPQRRRRPSLVAAVLTPPADGIVLRPPEIPTVVTEKPGRYNDTWFDRIAIDYLSQCVQSATGKRNGKSGYESLVEAAKAVTRSSDATAQRELVMVALERAFPRPILSLIRTLLPQSRFAREYFAVFTTVFFAWLVGPCEVRESEINGRREKNVVHIKKCRFLEETNCVGMCSNLCKVPSQSFIKDSLGMPVNMVPNFEDKSCDMIFGEEPPELMDDPVFKQPCYKLCRANLRHHKNCSS